MSKPKIKVGQTWHYRDNPAECIVRFTTKNQVVIQFVTGGLARNGPGHFVWRMWPRKQFVKKFGRIS